MKTLLNISRLLLAICLVACEESPIEPNLYSELENQSATRAITEMNGKDYYWSDGMKIYLDTDSTQMIVGFDNEQESKTFTSNMPKATPFTGKAMALIDIRDESAKRKSPLQKR